MAELPAKRVLVFRALPGLGDLLCTVPALRALRAGEPEAEITLLGLPQAAPFADRFPELIDRLLPFPGFPGLPEQPVRQAELLGLLGEVQGQYDLALQLHGSGPISNVLVSLLGARQAAGRFRPGQWCPDPARFLPYEDGQPEPLVWLRLMEFLGYPSQGETLAFPVHEADRAALLTLPGAHALRPGSYAVIHPGASQPERRWSPRNFALVAERLAARGLRVVLTGTSGEAETTRAVWEALNVPGVLDLTGQTDLGTLAALLAGARLLVSGDTGISHLAAATRTPSAVVFLASDPARWAPLDRERHRVVVGDDLGAVLHEVDFLLAREPQRVR
ncbi:glycosyltransferase family 9 protein (plasmid) [Deinococcus metallilatus]|uniref:ADP-heptose:LPS heptosyltransferase n=1 Tax=Deinococcus metallilatus TaxID=1211322 RepID=A0AAJ5JZH0_9DEIO|nr:glycosyltransferase family 9 protein [Deinococcus metallilatus]MBB5293261.1 ADP-heptose:LPS heptosyltransferase [Deinococcus metallilatus]QBY07043.1 glycosyltransferase family 9 protein [Deinococcus metallilatus]RXJ18054.1 glycosyltransferase family 9 protein [Deinococcus metallilatus]TLK31990.1 glycosyltransferase family 9 protein [Deinococcus metallilatus]